jgi:alkanesulfonate monooxygenase SsuD/methylene tetrahydromethanopterin reductase-like flavin-dependent oxidoreductase (luciferase family)
VSIVRRPRRRAVDHAGRHPAQGRASTRAARADADLIGGRMGAAVERAGRLGDGWLSGTTSSDAELAQ